MDASVLIVENDGDSREVLEVSLRSAGCRVRVAATGLEALQQIEAEAPDLIISETHMPAMDGFELAHRLKARPDWAGIPFMFLTDQKSPEDRIRGLELGVEDYLTKPIFMHELVVRARMVLQRVQRARIEADAPRTRFSGVLADMSVADLIQTLDVSRKSGLVRLERSDGARGEIYFRDGKVVDAEAGRVVGERALYRLLLWRDGKFAIEFKTIRRRDTIARNNQAVLLEGVRRLDEWTRLRESVPTLNSVVEVVYDRLAERLTDVPDAANALLRLVDGRRTLEQAIEDCELDDLEALRAVQHLAEKGILRVLATRAPGSAPREQTPPPTPVPPRVAALTRRKTTVWRKAEAPPPPSPSTPEPPAATFSAPSAPQARPPGRPVRARRPTVPGIVVSLPEEPGDGARVSTPVPAATRTTGERVPTPVPSAPSQSAERATTPAPTAPRMTSERVPTPVPQEQRTPDARVRPSAPRTPRVTVERPPAGASARTPVPSARTPVPEAPPPGPARRVPTPPASAGEAPPAPPAEPPPVAASPPSAEPPLFSKTLPPAPVIPFPARGDPGARAGDPGVRAGGPGIHAGSPTTPPAETPADEDFVHSLERLAREARSGKREGGTAEQDFFATPSLPDEVPLADADISGVRPIGGGRGRVLFFAVGGVVVLGAVAAIMLMRHPYWGTGTAARERFDAIDAAREARAAQVEKKVAQPTEAKPTPPPTPAPEAAAVAEPDLEPTPAAPAEASAATTPAPAEATPEPAAPAPEADADAYRELLARAQKAQRRGQGREARKLLDQALAANPQGDEALSLRAWVALDAGDGKEAATWADKALAVNADNARAHLVKGVRLHEIKRTAEAKSHYERYLELEPEGEHAAEVRRTLRGL